MSRKANAMCNIYVKGTKLRQRETFRYLGTFITQDGRNGVEISSLIAQANNFPKAKTVPYQQQHNVQDETETLQCYIQPILMYGCEAWTINKQTQKIGGGRNVVPE